MAMPAGDAGNTGGTPLPNIVPSIFVSSKKGDRPHSMTLRDCSSKLWRLKIEKLGDDWYFTDGWKEFVRDNKIAGGDVLVYESPCDGLIDFKILGPSGSAEEVEHLEYRNTKGREERPEVKSEDEDSADVEPEPTTQQEEKKKKKKRKKKKKVVDDSRVIKKRNRNSDFYGEELFNSGAVPQPPNPYFVAVANRTRINELYIPIDVVRCYNLKLPETLVIEDANGRRFNTQRRKWRDGRVLFYGGWKAVCKVNFVKKSDKIICEFVTGEDGNLELKVSFYHL